MFSVALSLALAAFAPILPVSSVASGAAIAVCFTPEEDCAAVAVRAINNAEREILVGAYGLTTGSGIVEALVRAEERGVDVRLIADRTTPCERASGIEPLAAAGVPIWIDAQARIAHAKTMVIDSAVTLTCSMNWTRGAARNSSGAAAAAYTAHWRERLGVAVRFDRREDWCSSAGSSPSADNTTVDGSGTDRRFDAGPISWAYLPGVMSRRTDRQRHADRAVLRRGEKGAAH